eukprot:6953617-Pyramimonas_sp.AAC.1
MPNGRDELTGDVSYSWSPVEAAIEGKYMLALRQRNTGCLHRNHILTPRTTDIQHRGEDDSPYRILDCGVQHLLFGEITAVVPVSYTHLTLPTILLV